MNKTLSLRPLVTSVMSAFVLAACSLAPTYEQPLAPIPSAYPDQSNSATDTQSIADIDWKNFYQDPQLIALIDLALENNRDLRIAVDRVSEAQAQFGIRQSDRFPAIGIGGNAEITHNSTNMRDAGAEHISRNYMAGASLLSFELDFFGRVKNQTEAAYQAFLATEQAQSTVHINLIAQVAQAYFNLRSAIELEQITEKTLNSRQETFKLVQARFDSGVASDLDLTQAQSQLDLASADLVAISRQKSLALNALRLLLGTEIPKDLPDNSIFSKDQLLASIPAGLPSDLLLRRPDILGAENHLLSANANVGAARAAFFPNISITGLLGFASPQLGGLFGSGNDFWQFSPQLAMPIFGGGQRGNLELAEARKNIAVSEYEKAIQVAFKEVADALAGESTYAKQLDAMRSLQDANMRALELSKLRYETGVDSFLQVQTAEINLYNTQRQFILLGTESLINRVLLYKALGGGWYKDQTE